LGEEVSDANFQPIRQHDRRVASKHLKGTIDDASPNSEVMGSSAQRRRGGARVLAIPLAIVLVVTGVFVTVVIRYLDRPTSAISIRASGIPANVSTSMANLMALSPVPNRPAPPFTLTDQNGRRISLGALKGRAVVLEFMDPHCVDICPLVAQEFVDAYRDLGSAKSRVVFAAVNVNPGFVSVADVAGFSREHQLDTIPSWHFFTGPVSELSKVWREYGIAVEVRRHKGDIVHTSVVEFIDSHGRERFIASPGDDHTAQGTAYLPGDQITAWGRGIALVVKPLST
jgi:cytochrome oxidase Cu insertion factor (SCO1/SenC/PrrC family)